MGFGYRKTNVPEGHLIVDARFILRRGDKEKILDRVRQLHEQRSGNQPWGSPMQDRFSRILSRSRRAN